MTRPLTTEPSRSVIWSAAVSARRAPAPGHAQHHDQQSEDHQTHDHGDDLPLRPRLDWTTSSVGNRPTPSTVRLSMKAVPGPTVDRQRATGLKILPATARPGALSCLCARLDRVGEHSALLERLQCRRSRPCSSRLVIAPSWPISRPSPRPGGWAAAVRDRQWPGVTDVVLAYQTVAVFADPEQVDLVELESRLRVIASDRRQPPHWQAGGHPGALRRGGFVATWPRGWP